MTKEKKGVEHDSYSSAPVVQNNRRSVVQEGEVYGTTIHSTTITDAQGKTYTGSGWTEQESAHKASEKFDAGDMDWN